MIELFLCRNVSNNRDALWLRAKLYILYTQYVLYMQPWKLNTLQLKETHAENTSKWWKHLHQFDSTCTAFRKNKVLQSEKTQPNMGTCWKYKNIASRTEHKGNQFQRDTTRWWTCSGHVTCCHGLWLFFVFPFKNIWCEIFAVYLTFGDY